MQDQVDLDYKIFKQKVNRKTGLDLDAYKQQQMERRLRSFMDRVGAVNFQQYYRMLESDDALMKQFMDRITINVSEFFRNPEQYEILRTCIIPELLKGSHIRVWSAGCSYGQEPYSLAICLQEASPLKPKSIIATDIDDRALESARKGIFTQSDVKNLSEKFKSRWLTREGENYIADDQLRSLQHRNACHYKRINEFDLQI